MIVGRKRLLTDDEADALYEEYRQWVDALTRLSPRALAKKYGITKRSVLRYGNRYHKSLRRAA